ncbi:hypothetical protein [Curtobacterium sp. HSID17257]|uniref:hypothetical protein n=1 Tax=Curtobacterium sp. HSID17257 TaxID=2419510 RepID=UPI000F86B7DD|nr:hypothetical protein [Curtobacterium sp. HSID17257]RUQ10132.1 hypothetical protein D8M35_00540 [Curtobacterium sp. HSID17257]
MKVWLHSSVVVPVEPATVLFSAVHEPWEPSAGDLAWLRRLEPVFRAGFSPEALRGRIPHVARPRFDAFLARLNARGYLISTRHQVSRLGSRVVVDESSEAVWLATPAHWPSGALDDAVRLLRDRGRTSGAATVRRSALDSAVRGLLRYQDEPGTTLTRVDAVSLAVSKHHFEPRTALDLHSDAGLARLLDEQVGLVSRVDESNIVQFPERISRATSFRQQLTVYAMAPSVATARMAAVRQVATVEYMQRVSPHRAVQNRNTGFGAGLDRGAARGAALMDVLGRMALAEGDPDEREVFVGPAHQLSVSRFDSEVVSTFVIASRGVEVARVVDTERERGRRRAAVLALMAERVILAVGDPTPSTLLVLGGSEDDSVRAPVEDELVSATRRAGLAVSYLPPVRNQCGVGQWRGLADARAVVRKVHHGNV